MKALIIYDSLYGNTEKIAQAIGSGIAGEVKVVKASEANPAELASYELVIVGAPTQGGRPSKPMQEFLGKTPADALKNVSVTAFDTRLKTKIVKIFGFAAGKIADSLKGKGGNLVVEPQGFFVQGKEPTLYEGELERAKEWGRGIG